MQRKLPAEWSEKLAGQPVALQMEYELNWELNLQQQVEQTPAERIFSCTYAYWTHTFSLSGVWNLERVIEAESEAMTQPETDPMEQQEVLQELEEQSDQELQQGTEKRSEDGKQPGAEDVAIEGESATEEASSTDVLPSVEKE